jgi:hypothetical protein
MYEQPSVHLELARQRHAVFMAEAERDRLAGEVGRTPSETVAVLKAVVSGLRGMLGKRQSVAARRPRLLPSA